jgi:hypothetical protein
MSLAVLNAMLFGGVQVDRETHVRPLVGEGNVERRVELEAEVELRSASRCSMAVAGTGLLLPLLVGLYAL